MTSSDVTDGYAILRATDASARFFAYASVIDNLTGDPIFILAVPTPRGSSPTPTPTQTPPSTPSYSSLQFALSLDSSGHPVNPGTSFASGSTVLYGWFQWSNVTAGTAFQVQWSLNNSLLTSVSDSFATASGYDSSALRKGGAVLDAGTYQFALVVGGHTVLSGQCTITGGGGNSGSNLAFLTPSGWSNCVVCNYRYNCCPPSTEHLTTTASTIAFFNVINNGTKATTKGFRIEFFVDAGSPVFYDETGTFPAGSSQLYPMTLQIGQTGTHTVTVVLDYLNAIAETNESDNSCSFTGTWNSVSYSPATTSGGVLMQPMWGLPDVHDTTDRGASEGTPWTAGNATSERGAK